MSSTDTFLGYIRSDGRVGVRNRLLILSVNGLTGPSAQRIARCVSDSVVFGTSYGAGLLGADRAAQERTLIGLADNPNIGAVLIIGADRPRLEQVRKAIAESGKPLESILLDDVGHDALVLSQRGVRLAARMAKTISTVQREPVPVEALTVGLECGRSDPSSGLVANPVLGLVTDRLVAAGATAMFGETAEWVGAESILKQRAATAELGEAIVTAAASREQMALDAGISMIGTNPGPTNIEAGLSSIEEKSLGNILKGGHSTIQGLLDYAERPSGSGLYLMDAPSYAPESLTGFAAAGAQLMLFTTGVGNSFVNSIAPTVKLSANPDTCERLQEQLDFTCEQAFLGYESLDSAAERLFVSCSRSPPANTPGVKFWLKAVNRSAASELRYESNTMSQAPRWDAIQSHPLDNVATLLRPVNRDETIAVQTRSDTLTRTAATEIPRCHKIALRPIDQGERILKYGATIGAARSVIAGGDWVHVHNLTSTRA